MRSWIGAAFLSLNVVWVVELTSVWRLDEDESRIVEASKGGSDDDLAFDIVASTEPRHGGWTRRHTDEPRPRHSAPRRAAAVDDDEPLDCGKAVNFTHYDNLVGVARRHGHPLAPEPQVALVFSERADVDALERRLRKAKRERPKSVQLYNQIGNFWRIKGDARQSIECFRRALAVSPHNAEVLLNLGRVLFALQYLDDAIYLTRRSLEVQPPDRSAWRQYFTLGEIFKAYGHYREASLHLRHALDLRPDFEPARAALKEMDSAPEAAVHAYTLVIIVCLVAAVLLVILSSVDSPQDQEDHKTQRHFNRAMAMRSLRSMAAPPPRTARSKRPY